MSKQLSFDELKALLELDVDALDECLMQQAKLYEQAAEEAAKADDIRAREELQLEELIAATDKDIRETAAVAGAKTTESAIKSEIALDRRVQAQQRVVLDAQNRVRLWKVLERSFSQRADMLSKLVDLHLRTTFGYSLENRSDRARGNLTAVSAEANRDAARAMRRQRLEEK